MKKVDLHVHSKYSGETTLCFFKQCKARESYTEPEMIYEKAKKMGMDYVTITDHNAIDGVKELIKKHPEDVFMGVEFTVLFPEDKTQVHVLVWDFTEEEFGILDQKETIYMSLEIVYVKFGLPHSVAHATYSVNKKLTIEHIERLILLFDCFEVMNGSRSFSSNHTLYEALKTLTPRKMKRLTKKYHISPNGPDSWNKGLRVVRMIMPDYGLVLLTQKQWQLLRRITFTTFCINILRQKGVTVIISI